MIDIQSRWPQLRGRPRTINVPALGKYSPGSRSAERGIAIEQAAGEMARKLGVARFGKPEEIAAAVAFLASPGAAYCQGVVLDVDGGQTRTL